MQVWHSFTLTRCNVVLYNMPEAKSRYTHLKCVSHTGQSHNPVLPFKILEVRWRTTSRRLLVFVACLSILFVLFPHMFLYFRVVRVHVRSLAFTKVEVLKMTSKASGGKITLISPLCVFLGSAQHGSAWLGLRNLLRRLNVHPHPCHPTVGEMYFLVRSERKRMAEERRRKEVILGIAGMRKCTNFPRGRII